MSRIKTLTLGVAVDSDYGPSPWSREVDHWAANVTLKLILVLIIILKGENCRMERELFLTAHVNTSVELTQRLVSETYLPKSESDLHSELATKSTLA